MAKKSYVGISGTAKNIPNKGYIGISNKSKKLLKGYVGVNGVAKQFWPSKDGWRTIFKDGAWVETWPLLLSGIITIDDYADTYRANADSWDYSRWNNYYNIREYLTTPIFTWEKLYAQSATVPYGWKIEGNELVFERADSQSAEGCTISIPIGRAYNLRGFAITGTIDASSQQQYGDIETGFYVRLKSSVPSASVFNPTVISGQRFWMNQYRTIKWEIPSQQSVDYVDSINISVKDNVKYKIKEIKILCDYDYLCATHEPDEYISGKIEEVHYDDIPSVFRAEMWLPPAYGFNYINYEFGGKNNNAKLARVFVKKRGTSEVRFVLLTDNPDNIAGRRISINNKRNISYTDIVRGSYWVWNEIQYAGNTYYVFGLNDVVPGFHNIDLDVYTYVDSNISGDWKIGEIAYFIFDGTTTRKKKEV